VIVSDGFVGNIALKICEGLAFQIFGLLKKVAGHFHLYASGRDAFKRRLQGAAKDD